jgi:hypothetical protein
MSRIEPREPLSTEGDEFADDHVEVLVEDLFIEEYPTAGLASSPTKERSRLARAVRPLRGGAGALFVGLAILGALTTFALVLDRRRSPLQRFLRRFAT